MLLAEHRVERCLPAADRVLVLDGGRIACDGAPRRVRRMGGGARAARWRRPAARMFSLAGLRPLPVSVKEARRHARRAASALRAGGSRPSAGSGRGRRSPRRRTPARCAALCARRVWVEFDDGRGRAPGAARRRPASSSRARRWRCWAETAPARARCCASRRACSSPRAGACEAAGEVALLLQTPSRLLPARAGRGRAARDGSRRPPCGARARARWPTRDPRDLSGGERQRLALGDRAGRARHRRRRAAGGGRARRADARDGPRPEGRRWRSVLARARRRAARP